MFFYSDTAPRSSVQIDVWRMNANKAYMRHYENFLFLDFILNNGNDREKVEAKVELKICERKLDFWKKHPNFEPQTVQALVEKMHIAWKRGDRPDVAALLSPRIPCKRSA